VASASAAPHVAQRGAGGSFASRSAAMNLFYLPGGGEAER
jgi:hypothetical protein